MFIYICYIRSLFLSSSLLVVFSSLCVESFRIQGLFFYASVEKQPTVLLKYKPLIRKLFLSMCEDTVNITAHEKNKGLFCSSQRTLWMNNISIAGIFFFAVNHRCSSLQKKNWLSAPLENLHRKHNTYLM